MKIEEAIEYWEQAFDKSCRNNLYQNAAKVDYEDAVWTAITALQAQREAQKNEPLTLEQLLEMDGQPVWLEHPDGYKHYDGWTLVFVSWKTKKQVRLTYATGGSGDVSLLLDNGAKIYRRPPEKEGEVT